MAATQIDVAVDSENQEPDVRYYWNSEHNCPVINFSTDYWNSMLDTCKLVMVGKFSKRKPKINRIRADFIAKNPTLKEIVKIASYDSQNVLLTFSNEEDFDTVVSKESITVAGALMQVSRWSLQFHPQFRGEEWDEPLHTVELDKTKRDGHISGANEYKTQESEPVPGQPHILEDDLDISNSSAPNGTAGGIPSVTDDSSSMCSTDIVPSVIKEPLRGTYLHHNNQNSYSRGWNCRSKSSTKAADCASETLSQPLDSLQIGEYHENQKVSLWPPDLHHEVGKQQRKAMYKERDAKPGIVEQQKTERDGLTSDKNEYKIEEPEVVLEKPHILDEVSDVSNSLHIIPEVTHPDSRDCDASLVNWDIDNSKTHPSIGTTCCRLSGLSAAHKMLAGRSYAMNDSPSACSTYSVPPVVTDGSYTVTSSIHKNQQPPSRGWNHRSKSTSDSTDCISKAHSQPLDALSDAGWLSDTSVSCQETWFDSQAIALSSFEQQVLKKEVVVSQQSKLTEADRERPSMEIPSASSPRSPPSGVQSKSKLKVSVTNDPNSVKRLTSDSPQLTHKSVPLANSAETALLFKPDPHKAIEPKAMGMPLVQSVSITAENFFSHQVTASPTAEMPTSLQVPVMSQCLNTPLPLPTLPLVAHSESAAGRLCTDPSIATDTYVPQSYPNEILGTIFGRNELAGRGSTFHSPSRTRDQQSLPQQHNQLNSYEVDCGTNTDPEPDVLSARTAQLQPPPITLVSNDTSFVRYRECLKNHAANMGGHAVDGCGEFMPNEKGTPGDLKCAACDCHRNFHRKEINSQSQMPCEGSYSTFYPPRYNSSSFYKYNQAPTSLPTMQLQQYDHNYSHSYSPSSLANPSQLYPQPPLPRSDPVFLPQGLERVEPSLIQPSYSYEMMNHDPMQNGQQWEYYRRGSNNNISRDHPSLQNENWNFDMFKSSNNRTLDHIPSEFPSCISRCQSQSVFANEFPHLDIINNLLHEEHETARTLMSNSGFQSLSNGSHHQNGHFTYPSDIGMSTGLGSSTSYCKSEYNPFGL